MVHVSMLHTKLEPGSFLSPSHCLQRGLGALGSCPSRLGQRAVAEGQGGTDWLAAESWRQTLSSLRRQSCHLGAKLKPQRERINLLCTGFCCPHSLTLHNVCALWPRHPLVMCQACAEAEDRSPLTVWEELKVLIFLS